MDYYIFQIGTTWDCWPASSIQLDVSDTGALSGFNYWDGSAWTALADIDFAWTVTGIVPAFEGMQALAASETYGGLTLIYEAP